MQSQSITLYILFGEVRQFLRDAKKGQPVHADGGVLTYIGVFLDYLDELGLPVTGRVALRGALGSFQNEMSNSEPDHTLTAEEAARLRNIVGDIQEVLSAELEGKVVFVVTDKRIDVKKLLSDMPALMAPDVFRSLPEIAQKDFTEAGRCIPFEFPTAAAFHLLRGTEAVLRHFYCSIVKRGRVNNLLWGPMVDHLRRRRRRLPVPLLDNLNNIRRSFRNPTQHPDKTYDIEEVQDLFGLCVDVVNRMTALLPKAADTTHHPG